MNKFTLLSSFARSLLFALAVFCFALNVDVSSAQAANEKIHYLELSSFSARTTAKGSQSYSPITVVLGIPGEKYFSYICRMGPRVRDSIVNYYNAQPIPMGKNGKLNPTDNSKKLIKKINEALNGAYVWRVLTAGGARTGVTKPTKKFGLKIERRCENGLMKSAK